MASAQTKSTSWVPIENMKNSKTMMKMSAVALLAGACLSGCVAAPPASGELAYGPRIYDRAAVIEPAIGIGGGRGFHDDHDR